jgi:osmoprotectant transport system permease protein
MKHWQKILIGTYIGCLALLLLAEFNVPGLAAVRATDQVLLLLALIFLPFVLLASVHVVGAITLKVSGKELHVEMREIKQQLEGVQRDTVGRFAMAEQVLVPMLIGEDPQRTARLEASGVIVVSKLAQSQLVLGHLLANHLQAGGVRCQRRVPGGNTLKNFADLKYGWIDAYIEYTGTACQMLGLDWRNHEDDQIWTQLNARTEGLGITWLRPLGFTDDYKIVMLADNAKKHGVDSIAGLRRLSRGLTFAADIEFLNRRDGYPSLTAVYGVCFGQIEICGFGDRYELLRSGAVDVTIGWESDPSLYAPDIVALDDPLKMFPTYRALPVVRTEALERVPNLRKALETFGQGLTTRRLTEAVEEIENRGADSEIYDAVARKMVSA